MKNLLESLNNLEKTWNGKYVILFLDYDGTLAPIAESPWKAVLPEENRELVERLCKVPQMQVVIISGRSLADVKQMTGIKGVVYIGNHGWEIEGSSMHFESVISVKFSSIKDRIKYELIRELSGIQGAFVEDKGMTLSVHYRLVVRGKEFLVRRIFEDICLPYQKKNMVKLSSGKKVLELRPPLDWDKGKAALWLVRKQEILKGEGHVLPVYLGDDTTDEDAFKALKTKGITVYVGQPRPSAARYCLNGTQQVTEFLKSMVPQEVH